MQELGALWYNWITMKRYCLLVFTTREGDRVCQDHVFVFPERALDDALEEHLLNPTASVSLYEDATGSATWTYEPTRE